VGKVMGVQDDDLPRLLNIEKSPRMVGGIVRKHLDNSDFGGSWIDVKKDKIFINAVDPSKSEEIKSIPEIKPYVRFLEIEIAPNSLANLSSSFEQIIQLAKNKKAVDVYLYVNISINNVVLRFIYQPPEQHTTKRQNGVRVSAIGKTYYCGDGVYRKAGQYLCSVGFFERDKKDPNPLKLYIVTAGHCHNPDKLDSESFATELIITDIVAGHDFRRDF
ncbi:34981_t:CDS:2, partial [Racocetra persica]